MNFDWITQFPDTFKLNINDSIDQFVNNLNRNFEGFFDIIKNIVLSFLNAIGFVVNLIPWWLFVIIIFVLGWKSSKKIHKGIIYCLLYTSDAADDLLCVDLGGR